MDSNEQAPYTLCESPTHFYLRCLTTGPHFFTVRSGAGKQMLNSSSNSYLSINKHTNHLKELPYEAYKSSIKQIAISQFIRFYHLMGTIIVNHEPFLLLATAAREVARYVEYPIMAVSELKFVPYRRKKYQKEEQIEQQNRVIELLRDYIADNFYFSYKENITCALTSSNRESVWKFQFNEFAWNTQLLNPFLKSNLPPCWTIPAIQGFVAEVKTNCKYFSWWYLSISRRSMHMSGTRFNSRGLDQAGHASNFVQTEEIIKCHNQLYVHLSNRGSVPLFWKQAKFKGNIKFAQNNKIDEQMVLKTHYERLEKLYKAQITTINLLSRDKSPEKELKNRFEALFARNISHPYLFFDLNEIMQTNYNGQYFISDFISKNKQLIFGSIPFTILQNITLQVKQLQQIIPRVNCLDCLDRTNVMLARISQNFFKKVAHRINEQAEEEKRITLSQQFIDKLILIWAHLGDRISNIYCGTASIASHMTRKENNSLISTLGGALTSFNRYLNSVGSDLFKQQCIDSLLGKKEPHYASNYFQQNIALEIPEKEFCTYSDALITIATFSTCFSNPTNPSAAAFQAWIKAITIQKCDILLINLQQVTMPQKWNQKLKYLLQGRGYSLLIQVQHQKVKLMSLVFTTKTSLEAKYLQMIQIPLKSNGALALFLKLNDSIICAINCRLQSGYSNVFMRIDDFNQLHTHLLQQTYSSRIFKQSQTIFLAGDFNLRLSVNIQKQFKFKNLVEQLYKGQLSSNADLVKEALAYDELQLLRKNHFFLYCESRIEFLPSYRFHIKKGGYDRAKLPAWCDRIFYSQPGFARRGMETEPIKCLLYNKIEERLGSTHKCVMGSFKFSVKKQDQELKQQLVQKYIDSK